MAAKCLINTAEIGQVELAAQLLAWDEKTTQLEFLLLAKGKVGAEIVMNKDAHFSTELGLTRTGTRL